MGVIGLRHMILLDHVPQNIIVDIFRYPYEIYFENDDNNIVEGMSSAGFQPQFFPLCNLDEV